MIKKILFAYKDALGQAVNFQKSSLFFSKNVPTDLWLSIFMDMEVTEDNGTDRYLGMPIIIGRKKSETFKFFKEKLSKRVNS